MTHYADLIVDNNTNATDEFYTYKTDMEGLEPGMRVRVPFSVHNRMTDGFVVSVSDEAPEGVKRFKKIAEISGEPGISREALETAVWLKRRCLCRYIEAVRLFLPGYAEVKRKTRDPFENIEEKRDEPPELTAEQKPVVEELCKAVEAKRHGAFLLFGVTGSGKTEVYLRAVQRALELGRQAIVLVPEISLTPQTVSRFVNRFGRDAIAVIHSRLTPAQRAVEYKKIEQGSVKVVVGARSAIFAPFKNIGIIIIDEEHESSYKSDMSPKYDAVEVAYRRSKAHGGVLVLGSATPSAANWHRSETGIYKRLELSSRYNLTPLPRTEIVDMSAEVRAGNMGIFSRRLAEAAEAELAAGRQVILFLNRRGYASYVSCRKCGYVVKCPECGISMVYHKEENACVCHYCGRKTAFSKTCPECGSNEVGFFGFGTEQAEEKAAELFPEARTERLDFDSVKRKGALEAVLRRFAEGKTDMLIGTQLVAKGLDFSNVGLVGILSADVTLNIPDFRSSERGFQLITQAAGRAGRGSERGLVIIQTYQPEHRAVLAAARQEYKSFYRNEIEVRRALGYPPFSDIFRLIISDEDEGRAMRSAEASVRWLRKRIFEGAAVLGPVKTALQKLEGMYRYQILIKVPIGGRKEVSDLIYGLKTTFANASGTARLLTADVNPYSMI